MTLKKLRLIAYFLDNLKERLEKQKSNELHHELLNYLTREELIEIIKWLYEGDHFEIKDLLVMSNKELFILIGNDVYILSFLLEKWNTAIFKTPSFDEDEVNSLFSSFGIGAHYLRHKSTNNWDDYDKSNYYSILRKHGRAKRIYGLFTSDVKEEDKYLTTTKPSLLFDTEEEAQEKIEQFYYHGQHEQNSLKVLSLWQLINF